MTRKGVKVEIEITEVKKMSDLHMPHIGLLQDKLDTIMTCRVNFCIEERNLLLFYTSVIINTTFETNMIIFRTEFAEYFNKKIHDFLRVHYIDVYSEDESSDRIEWFFPKYLIREQKEKCITTFEELYEWTGDRYGHSMTAFHEMGLYWFLDYIHDLRKDMPEFDSIYYDAEDKKEVEALWSKFDIKGMFEGAIKNTEGLAEFVHDIGTMQELCFEDTDFLMLPDLSNHHSVGDYFLEEVMGIDFDYYKEILPKDIRAQYEIQALELTLIHDILEMLEFVSDRISYRGLHKTFWHDDKPIKEPEVQVLLDSLFAAYLEDKGLGISREVDLGTGRIDFKFFKNHKEEVLIEVKLGNSLSSVERGMKNQLPHYMNAAKCKYAVYLVVCYTEKDLMKVKKFFEDYQPDRSIVPFIFDASKKTVASRL